MRLLLSDDEGDSWRVLRELEPNGAGARYPMLRRLDGERSRWPTRWGTRRGFGRMC